MFRNQSNYNNELDVLGYVWRSLTFETKIQGRPSYSGDVFILYVVQKDEHILINKSTCGHTEDASMSKAISASIYIGKYGNI